jgi:transcription initiation factor TFIIB
VSGSTVEHAKAVPRSGKFRKRNALHAACIHVWWTFKAELAQVTGDSATAGLKDIGKLVKHTMKHLGEEDGGQAAGEKTLMGAVVRAGDYLRGFGSLVGIGD